MLQHSSAIEPKSAGVMDHAHGYQIMKGKDLRHQKGKRDIKLLTMAQIVALEVLFRELLLLTQVLMHASRNHSDQSRRGHQVRRVAHTNSFGIRCAINSEGAVLVRMCNDSERPWRE
jgi:hypothetical protein